MTDRPPRLLADSMLGRLARWLRLLGYDTDYGKDATDHELARRARAEGRVLLTRDRALSQRRGLETVYIRSQQLATQLEEVCESVGPPVDPSLSRCSVCNAVVERVGCEELVELVPEYVLQTHDRFRRCPECGRVYWAGSHVEMMDEQLAGLDLWWRS